MRGGLLSASSSPTAPLGGIWQHEHVQTREQHKEEGRQWRIDHPSRGLPQSHGNEVSNDSQCKDNGQPSVDLPNAFVPAH